MSFMCMSQRSTHLGASTLALSPCSPEGRSGREASHVAIWHFRASCVLGLPDPYTALLAVLDGSAWAGVTRHSRPRMVSQTQT